MQEQRTPYGSLLEGFLRIGDTEFYVPPTAIRVQKQMQNKRSKVLRSRNSLPKESGYYNQIVELNIFFPDRQSINDELRPLLAQLKKCPFLPIENSHLNDIYKIDAVTISGVTVQTVTGFPNTLQAQIQCYAFEPLSYIADDEDRTFDEMFDWKLFRWYYERNLDPLQAGVFNTYYEPLLMDLDDAFKFRIAAQDDLDEMAAWRKEKSKLIKNYINDKEEKFYGKEILEDEFNKKLDNMYDKAKFEYDIHYEDYDIPGLILTDISVGFENTITSQQLQGDAMPTHQYMGSQDTIVVAKFQTNSKESLASLESLLQRTTYLIRNYHKEVANGFLELDHQLLRLFGVKNVTIEDVHSRTIEGLPDAHEITVTFMAYNRIERKLNEVKWLSETAAWDIDKYQDQGFWSLFTAVNPINWMPGPLDEDQGLNDWVQLNPLVRFGRYFWDRPISKKLIGSLKIFFAGHDRSVVNVDENDIKNIIYDEAIRQFFTAAEVYPDLELPTYGECIAAGFDVEDTNGGVFVEPDFFIKYNKRILLQESLLSAMNKNYDTVLRDSSGGEISINGSKVKGANEKAQQEMKKNEEEYKSAHEESQVNYENVSEELVDSQNISKDEMETLIREKAELAGINQNFPLAFVKAMDSEMKQFYKSGTNAKQGKVNNSNTSSPVMMDSNFNFYTNKDGLIDGEYIGVMKVRKMYGSNVNMLGKNIEYNVESGIKKMATLYSELDRIHVNSGNGGSEIYKEQNVYDLFGLENKRGSFDAEKARFVGVIMMYLGFSKEYTALIKDNKKPPAKLVSLLNNILTEAENKKEWTSSEIKKKVKDLPIKDFKTPGDSNSTVKSTGMTTADFTNDEKLHHGMLHDMMRYDKRGRLVRAFPTFFLTFIDEGQFIGTVKLSDQYFQYQAVMDIMYTNSRKEASSTLVLEMSNVFGSLDDAEKGMDLTNTSYSEVFKTMTMPGAVAKEAERSRHKNKNFYKSIMLRTGTRIHFRMGYGSNAMEMPTIMNGTITSIQNNGESITVIAQDDGIELTNKIRADVNETTDGGFLFSKKEPTEIVDEILTDSQGFFKNLWAGLSNKEFENHSLGIMHFGSQGAPQGWDSLGSVFGGMVAGGASGAFVGGPMGALVGALGGGIFGGLTMGRENREIREINMNVYQTTGLTNEEHDKWWNRIKDGLGIGQADEPGINIGLFDKSIWDVLNICASIGDDHIVAVHPFGFRNTVFSGKTHFPLHYDYIVDGEILTGTAVKPFRQYHAYDSNTSIISNTIQTTEENVKTVAVGVYMNEGEMDMTSPIYVDTNIWPEKQRVVNIDTTMNAQGVRLVENIPLVGGLLNKPFKWYFDEGVAIKIAARGLSDYVRDMYDGYLTVMGDPSVKPYDQAWIGDTYNDINGTVDIKEVTHIMNHDVGYITLIKPDAVVVNSDSTSINTAVALQNLVGPVLITMGLRKMLATSKYAGNLPILNSLWANTVTRSLNKFKTSEVAKKIQKNLGSHKGVSKKIKKDNEKRVGTGAKDEDIARWKKNGMLKKLQEVTGIESKENLPDLLKDSKKFGKEWIASDKLKGKASGLISSGTKNLRKVLGGGKNLAKVLWGGAHVLSGPIGWLALAIETVAMEILCATVGEFVERWLFMRQCCIVAPLKKSGMEFSAGLNGHNGSVVGDSPDFWQGLLTNDFSALLLGFVGVDAWKYSQDAREGQLQSVTSLSTEIDMSSLARDFISQFRKSPSSSDNSTRYENDRKAALQQLNSRLELLSKRDSKPDYESIKDKDEVASNSKAKSNESNLMKSIKNSSTNTDGKAVQEVNLVQASSSLEKAINLYGKKVNIIANPKKDESNVRLEMPSKMVMTNGKLRYVNKKEKNDARNLIENCIQAGFKKLYFGDWDIVQEMNKKYGNNMMIYEPTKHFNQLRLVY